jgi:Domain of unknown function (DUF4055)
MLFRKPPVIKAQQTILDLLKDATLAGCPFDVFAQEITEECLTVGRVGVLVDYPNQNTKGLTAAEAESLNLRPSMQAYEAESIINWKMARVNNAYVLVQVVLTECHYEPKDEYEDEEETRYRVLDIQDGIYRQRVYRQEKGKDILLSEYIPVMNGKPLSYIPFVFFSTDDLDSDICEPVIIDLVDLNLAHYRVSADYEHGCHFTGLPTAVITGYQPDDSTKISIGSTSPIALPDPSAKAFYLEFTGQGLTSLENNLKSKEQQMAILGARMLTADKKGIESADTANIHRAGESSILSKTAQTISDGLTRVLRIFSDWAGVSSEVSCEINREFAAMTMTPQDAVSFMQLVQGGAMSAESAFINMKKGGLYEDLDTFELEQARIGDVAPPAPINQPAA